LIASDLALQQATRSLTKLTRSYRRRLISTAVTIGVTALLAGLLTGLLIS
jgi:hypothetical protein